MEPAFHQHCRLTNTDRSLSLHGSHGLGSAPAHFIYIDSYKSLHTVKNENKIYDKFAHYENRKEFKYISNDGLFHSKKKNVLKYEIRKFERKRQFSNSRQRSQNQNSLCILCNSRVNECKHNPWNPGTHFFRLAWILLNVYFCFVLHEKCVQSNRKYKET